VAAADHVLKSQLTTLANDLQYHVETTATWQLETRMEYAFDKRWKLDRRMAQSGSQVLINDETTQVPVKRGYTDRKRSRIGC